MITWGDIYKVVAAMAPLYFALGLGFGSVRWWRFFTAEQCGAINTLVVNFSMPFFTFDFLARADPYTMNFRVLAADAVSKLLAIAAVSATSWACFRFGGSKLNKPKQAGGGALSWAITGFSLAGFNNTLVVGVPLLHAMYGKWAQDLIVQIAVVQSLFWFPLLLLGFELRKAWVRIVPSSARGGGGGSRCGNSGSDNDDDYSAAGGRVGPVSSSSSSSSSSSPSSSPSPASTPLPPPPPKKDGDVDAEKDVEMNAEEEEAASAAGETKFRVWPMVRTVGLKLAANPNVYASVIGVVWACIAYRWDLSMPGIVTGSLDVMAKTGTGMQMFSMGLFMAQQKKLIACGAGPATLGMALRFVAAPLATLIGAAAFGLRGDVLRFAIVQAALPQSIASFAFAKEYGLHADVLSTAVIFGTLVSLPVLIAYYAVLGIM